MMSIRLDRTEAHKGNIDFSVATYSLAIATY